MIVEPSFLFVLSTFPFVSREKYRCHFLQEIRHAFSNIKLVYGPTEEKKMNKKIEISQHTDLYELSSVCISYKFAVIVCDFLYGLSYLINSTIESSRTVYKIRIIRKFFVKFIQIYLLDCFFFFCKVMLNPMENISINYYSLVLHELFNNKYYIPTRQNL